MYGPSDAFWFARWSLGVPQGISKVCTEVRKPSVMEICHNKFQEKWSSASRGVGWCRRSSCGRRRKWENCYFNSAAMPSLGFTIFLIVYSEISSEQQTVISYHLINYLLILAIRKTYFVTIEKKAVKVVETAAPRAGSAQGDNMSSVYIHHQWIKHKSCNL